MQSVHPPVVIAVGLPEFTMRLPFTLRPERLPPMNSPGLGPGPRASTRTLTFAGCGSPQSDPPAHAHRRRAPRTLNTYPLCSVTEIRTTFGFGRDPGSHAIASQVIVGAPEVAAKWAKT